MSNLQRPDHQRFLHPSDGRPVPLITQSIQDPVNLPQTSQWTRSGKPASQISCMQKVAYWAGKSMLEEGTEERNITPKALGQMLFRLTLAWPVSCLLVSGLDLAIPNLAHKHNFGPDSDPRYDVVRIRDVGSTSSSSSSFGPRASSRSASPLPRAREENLTHRRSQSYLSDIRMGSHLAPPTSRSPEDLVSNNDILGRSDSAGFLRPRYLCYVHDFEQGLWETINTSDFIHEHGEDVDIEFIFISYTRMQFRVATDAEIDSYEYPNQQIREANRTIARQDRELLVQWGLHAAKAAGKKAFWLDFECVRDADGVARSTSNSEDVYRICDIVRAAHSMIIAIGPSTTDKVASLLTRDKDPDYNPENVTRWLREWGSRLWTLPELLLCPSEYRIKLYVAGGPDEPKILAKRNFAERAWDDAESVKELVNHYEGSAILTQLQLIETALECFSRRKTDQFSQGDIAYAIMGLLPDRQRPKIVQKDSGFQAFARLSLANDSGGFLERMLCLAPLSPTAKWYDIEDYWYAKLKDIIPNNQVVEIDDEDVIWLDGVSGALIHWEAIDGSRCLSVVSSLSQTTLALILSMTVVIPKIWALMALFIMGAIGQTSGGPTSLLALMAIGGLGFSIILAFFAPALLLIPGHGRGGSEKSGVQAKLIGIEGLVDPGTIEKYLWGFNFGKLTLVNDFPQVTDNVGSSKQKSFAFTIVDTNTLTVHHFHARKPPTAMFIVGQEGGMQRAVLCSYDWQKDTFFREAVLRVSSKAIEQMRRVDRFRFSIDSRDQPNNDGDDDDEQMQTDTRDDEAASRVVDAEHPDVAFLDDKKHPWSMDFTFFTIALLGLNTMSYAHGTRFDGWNYGYWVGFLGAQLPGFFMIRYFSLSRLIVHLALLKGHATILFWSFQTLEVVRRYKLFNGAWICGAADGLLLPCFVLLTWNWYPSSQQPFRILCWFTLGGAVMDFLFSYGRIENQAWEMILSGMACAGTPALCFALAMAPYVSVGSPRETFWLSGPKRKLIETNAATFKFGTWKPPVWVNKKWHAIAFARLLAFFSISVLNSTASNERLSLRGRSGLDDVLLIAALVGVGLITLKFERYTSLLLSGMIFLSVGGAALSYGRSGKGSPALLLSGLHNLVQPVLWAVIPRHSNSLNQGILLMCLSLSGVASGKLITVSSHDSHLLPIILIPIEGTIVLLLYLAEWREEQHIARKASLQAGAAEYRDDSSLDGDDSP